MKKLRTKCLFVVFAACLAACSNDDLISGFQEKKKFLFFTSYSKGHAFITDGYIKYNRPDNPYYLHINYGWGEEEKYDDVYALNDNKWYDKKEAERLPYGKIYEFKMLYYCYAHASEKNW